MSAAASPPVRSANEQVPSPQQADDLACALLAGEGTRLEHVRTAAFVAGQLTGLLDPEEGRLLVAAATLHDIGYTAALRSTGFHPLDGGLYLRDHGYSPRLAGLVAHHSMAGLMAGRQGVEELSAYFPEERSLLADALVYADMHSAPDGRIIRGEARLADIGARRPSRTELVRAAALRQAMARVGAALLESNTTAGTITGGPWTDIEHTAAPAPGARRVTPGFRAWWHQEARRCVSVAHAARRAEPLVTPAAS